MPAAIIPVPDFDCVVFGATGDLTLRKLLPALYYRHVDKQYGDKCRIIAAARSQMSTEEYRKRAADALAEHVAKADQSPEKLAAFLDRLSYIPSLRRVGADVLQLQDLGLVGGQAIG